MRADHPRPTTIAICDDHPVDRDVLAHVVGCCPRTPQPVVSIMAADVATLLAAVAHERPTLCLMDDWLLEHTAEASLARIRAAGVGLDCVIITSDLPPGRREALLRLGAMECVSKDDLSPARIADLIDMALQRSAMLRPAGHATHAPAAVRRCA